MVKLRASLAFASTTSLASLSHIAHTLSHTPSFHAMVPVHTVTSRSTTFSTSLPYVKPQGRTPRFSQKLSDEVFGDADDIGLSVDKKAIVIPNETAFFARVGVDEYLQTHLSFDSKSLFRLPAIGFGSADERLVDRLTDLLSRVCARRADDREQWLSSLAGSHSS